MSTFLPPNTIQRISREIMDLQKNKIDGIEILTYDPVRNVDLLSDLSEIYACIDGPQGTPFESGKFVVKLVLDQEFPTKPPKGYFVTKIFHPNVSPREGEICVNTLKRDWKSTLGFKHVLMVIRCLMIEPNPDSALNAEAGRLIQDNYEAYANKAKMFTDIYAKQQGLSSPSATESNNMDTQSLNKTSSFTPSTPSDDSDVKENLCNNNNTPQSLPVPKKPLLLKKPTSSTTSSTTSKPTSLKRL
ncbi:hypothetical protein FDP41_013061 [Naegleria fowleri]|uniref:E2 ubiquitin-conjugating enzyme n=1 Tax=Naegleria fowleri TaxID=5763 RepID=A0A6A5C3Z2_NAEFO|nr:uncharacterized protein FDP41_013061 [Naegleria fowleri]KAF0980578.1 hypothetical protein FDP41_013061 [Naegleria fowleri]CAG4709621.1 unnamed protein product [Naegleria fowleri]